MANLCEIQLGRTIQSSNDFEQSLKRISSEIAEDLDQDKTDVERELRRILKEVNNINHVTNIQDMIAIFINSANMTNHTLYRQTKSRIRYRILTILLNSSILTDDILNDSLSSLQSELNDNYDNDPDLQVKLWMKVKKFIDTNDSLYDGCIEDYLLLYHLPELAKTWLNDIIVYENGKYHLKFQQKIRQDWNSEKEGEQEPDANGIIKLLLEATPLYDFSNRTGNSLTGVKRIVSTYKLTPKVFLDAISNEIESMSEHDLKEFLKDGRYLFEYLRSKYIYSVSVDGIDYHPTTFAENLMYSFTWHWLADKKPLYKSFNKQSLAFSHKIYDIILTAFEKYRSNNYIEYDANGNISRFGLKLDETSTFFGRLSDKLSTESYRNYLRKYFDTVYDGEFDELFVASQNDLFVKEIFGFQAKYNVIYDSEYSLALKAIKQFLDDNATDFEKWCKSNSKTSDILAAINVANMYNPFSISGTKKSKAGKQLPVMGIRSLANSIRETIIRRKIQDEENTMNYYGNSELIKFAPIFPGSHSSIYKSPKIFKQTIYRASLSSKDGEKIKTMGDLSTPEAWTLTYGIDFESKWDKGSVIIQAITPSDKSKIPNFEFDINWLKKDTENIVFKEMQNIYAQQWLNTIIDFALVFGWTSELEGLTNDVTKIKTDVVETLTRWTNTINSNLLSWSEAQTNITEALNRKVSEFNKKYGVNKNIAKLHDYIPYIVNKTKTIIINPYHQEATELWSGSRDNENLQRILLQYLKNVIKLDPDQFIKMEDGSKVSVNTLLNGDVINPKFFDSFLYKYFLVKNLLSENILVNTVGTAIAHKHDMSKGFEAADSSAHLTMVKRMVALTATMHACSKNVLTGLPNHINTVTIDTPAQQMFTYAGNAADGKGSKSDLDVSDGACWCPGFVNLMLRQSIGDVKPNGIDQKLILHAQDDEKASAYLLKMANFVIDNAFLRKFSIPGMTSVGARDPMEFIRMSLQGVKISDISFSNDGLLIDFNGNKIFSNHLYFKTGDEVIHVNEIKKINGEIYVIYSNGQVSKPCIDLYDVFNAIGAQWSCTKDGEYNESSQHFIASLLCKLGRKIDDNAVSQSQVDQYAKKQIIHFFPSDSVVKSLKTPINQWGSKEFIIKMDISNFGLQLDPDHEAEDGEIAEITQLMSFISEKMKTPELTEMVYTKLVDLINILSEKHFVNLESIHNPDEREAARRLLDKSFGRIMENIFADPNTETKGLINGFMREIKKIDSALNSEGFIYSAPYSDHQMLGKAHTSIGSLFRKYIRRTWSGRADVLVPSHNMAMLFEDEQGNTFMLGDSKYVVNDNGEINRINIIDYLDNLIWATDEYGNKYIKPDYIDKFKCQKYNIKFGYNYYHINSNGILELIIVDSYEKLINLSSLISDNEIVVPALDKPRNLANMQAFLKVQFDDGTEEMINMYFLPILRYIFDGGYVDEFGRTISKDTLQNNYQNFILPAIQEGNVDILSDQFKQLFGHKGIKSFEYVQFDQERFTTNNYSNVFGDNQMNFSEIQQLKDVYFYTLLKDRFDQVLNISTENTKGIFYSSNGMPIELLKQEPNIASEYTEELPTLDDEGFLINEQGKRLFKWIDGAKLYLRSIEGIGIIHSIYVPDQIESKDKHIIEFINSGNFIFSKFCDLEIQDLMKTIKNNRIQSLDVDDSQIDMIFQRVSQRQYVSWLRSNLAIMSRIPAQSVSFATISKTVGYLPYSNNITMVPNGNVYTQGSDYDIDKVTAIMASIDQNGLYRQSTTYRLNIDKFDLSEINQTITDQINTFIEEIAFEGLSDNEIKISVNTRLLPIIYSVLENGDVNLNKMDFQYKDDEIYSNQYNRVANLVLQYISDVINNPSKLEELKYNGDHIQNQILETLIKIYHDPRSLYNQSDPTSMQVVKEASASAPNAKEIRSHWDPTTDIYVNQTTSVGKKDIGISAVAQKAFYALNYHYFNKQNRGETIIHPNVITWNGKNHVNFGWNGMTLKQTDIIGFEEILRTNQLDGWKFDKDSYVQSSTGLKLQFKKDENGIVSLYYSFDNENWILVNNNQPIGNFSLTTINSSLISSSTDNAKEMLMDVMNATPEILPAYEYLISLNMKLIDAVQILTDPIIPELIILSRGNVFKNEMGKRVSKLFDKTSKTKIENKLGIKIDLSKWYTLSKIFKGAEELTALGQTLGINGGFKVETGEELLWELRLEKTIHDKTEKRFSTPRFLYDDSYAMQWIDIYDQYKTSYNILEVLKSVPHFYKMMQVPIQFRTSMQLLSKDMDNLYTIGRSLSFNYELNSDILRSLLRAINDRKIVDFLIQHPFEYQSEFQYSENGKRIEGDEILTTKQISKDENGRSIISYNGLFTLKYYIEEVIIPMLQNKYGNNLFIRNLMPRTMNSNMWKTQIHFFGSAIDLSDPQNEDQRELIRSDFAKIAQEKIDERHTILDWMFLYDLIVHKHTIGSNSLTMLFEDHFINSDLIKNWYKFINEYDQLFPTYHENLQIWRAIPGIAKLQDEENPFDDSPKGPGLPSFSIWPFFVRPRNVGDILLSDEQVLKLFNSGKLIAKIC